MIAATTTLFIGWWRPDKRTRWTRLADGDDYDAAWASLLDALASVHGGESMVLRGCENPNGGGRRMGAKGRR
jgi:hypothetical protein